MPPTRTRGDERGVIVDLRRVPRAVPALFDLNTLVMNGAGWTIRTGADVNNAWEIVGTGTYNGPQRAILLAAAPVLGHDRPHGQRLGHGAGHDRMRGPVRRPHGSRLEPDAARAPRERLALRPLAGELHRDEAHVHALRRRSDHRGRGLRSGASTVQVHGDHHHRIAPQQHGHRRWWTARAPRDRLAHALRGRSRRPLPGTATSRAACRGGDARLAGNRADRVRRTLSCLRRASGRRAVRGDARRERRVAPGSDRAATAQGVPAGGTCSRGGRRPDRARPRPARLGAAAAPHAARAAATSPRRCRRGRTRAAGAPARMDGGQRRPGRSRSRGPDGCSSGPAFRRRPPDATRARPRCATAHRR